MASIGSVSILLIFILSFALWMGVPEHPKPLLFSIATGDIELTLNSSLYIKIFFLLTSSLAIWVSASLFKTQSPYSLFAGITVFLLSFATLPLDLFSAVSVPMEIKFLVGGSFAILYMLSVLSWFKGTGEF